MSSSKLATAALAGLLSVSIMGASIAQAAEGDKMTSSSSSMEKEKHACKGHNSCKGMGADGKNDCKGKGSCATDGSK
jgi:hypothetical protein